MIVGRWKEPSGRMRYISTGKEPEEYTRNEDLAYWALAGRIEDWFGKDGGTIGDIYHNITGPLGLSLDETRILVTGAKRRGYLKCTVG